MRSRVNKEWANVGGAIAVNECLEVVRFPLILATTPAVTRIIRRVAVRDIRLAGVCLLCSTPLLHGFVTGRRAVSDHGDDTGQTELSTTPE